MGVWLTTLRDAGYTARLTDGGRRLQLQDGDGYTAAWLIRRVARTPRPSELRGTSNELVWTPTASPALARRFDELGISWVSDSGEVHLRAPWGSIIQVPAQVEARSGSAASGFHHSPGALATLQYLLEHPREATQVQIGAAIGVSQPRVAQVLAELGRDNLVARSRQGWQVVEPPRAFDVWVEAGPAPTTLATGWYSVDRPMQQIAAVARGAQAVGANVRLCGDWAADRLAPWRQPGRIVVHSDTSLDLDEAGFVPADDEVATLIVHIGVVRPQWSIPTEFVTALAADPPDLPIAPATEIAREIVADGASDADEAVAELRRAWLQARDRVRAEAMR